MIEDLCFSRAKFRIQLTHRRRAKKSHRSGLHYLDHIVAAGVPVGARRLMEFVP